MGDLLSLQKHYVFHSQQKLTTTTLRFNGQLHDTVGKPVPECQTSCILLQQEMVEVTV